MLEFKKHLTRRGLTDDIKCYIDYTDEIVTFPLYTPSGELMGTQKYQWNEEKVRCNAGKYYTYVGRKYRPCKRTPALCFWGMEYLDKCEPGQSLFVTEGIWDAIRVIQAGHLAVATLTATPSKQFIQWFQMLTFRYHTIALCDNDESGTGLKMAKLTDDHRVCPKAYPDFNSFPVPMAKVYLHEVLKLFRK